MRYGRVFLLYDLFMVKVFWYMWFGKLVVFWGFVWFYIYVIGVKVYEGGFILFYYFII